eukprot:176219_1
MSFSQRLQQQSKQQQRPQSNKQQRAPQQQQRQPNRQQRPQQNQQNRQNRQNQQKNVQQRQQRSQPNKQQRAPQQQRPKPKPKPKISAVQIEGFVLLKIIKNCGEYLAQQQAVNGTLLGLQNNNTMEVTNCFPTPTHFSETDASNENEKKRAQRDANKYSQQMIQIMQRIREDNNIIGWYRSALNG